ncbi:amidase [Alcaligenes faecalis]|uniref:amidase n=1 Tax=Alcaligenes faecalis TaxID=511 RepID=UPI000F0B53B1|nr:amidase [Alcaligenes faecalis]AYR21089.1 amidase [Alcaligenes faecalis]
MTDFPTLLGTRRRFLKTTGLLSLASMAPYLGRQAFAKTAPGPGTAQDIIMADALTLSGWIAQRQVSCREVMVAYLDHIDRVNPKVNAIVSLQERSGLLAQADKRDQQLKAGQYMGWMHGMPQAPKDLAATVDIVTTNGSPIFKDYLPKQDAIVVERVRQSGAIVIGKTNTPEFGLGSHTYNSVFGTTGNAYQPDLCAGGSSGGAAVALATRMLPVADGSDMMGSLRNPGAFNNVYGFRPSQGRVPYGPTSEVFFQQMGYEGPMGRTVSDLAMLLSTQAGFDARAPLSIGQDPQQFTGKLQRDFKGTRIGWLGDYNGYLPMQAGVMDLCQHALKSFEAIGCTVEAAQPDYSMEQLWQTWLTLRHFTVAGTAQGLYAKPELRAQMKPEAIWEIEGGLNLTGAQVYQASINRSKWYESLRKLFQTYDYLVLPTAQVFPFAGTTHWPTEIAGRQMDTYHRWMEIVIGGSLAGLPVMNVPAGFNEAGLPMGLQIMGPAQADMAVLQLSHAYEQATQWVQKSKPALLG